MNQRSSMILTVVIGLASGLVGSALGGAASKSETAASSTEEEAKLTFVQGTEEKLPNWLQDNQNRRLERLERQLAARQNGATEEHDEETPTPQGTHTLARSSWRPTSPPALEEVRDRALTAWEDRLQKIEDEPVDASWARQKESALSSGIQALSRAGGFKLVSTQCKTISCAATMEWSDYASAMKSYSVVLHDSQQAKCRRKILLPEPDNKNAPYQATIVLDCSSERGS